jgi:radical SAM superfamily enzyme YgiQ (UPF0313 family)
MRVLLISSNREEISMRTLPLGLACVAAAVSRAGHEVKLLDLMQEEDPRGAVRQALLVFQPEAVGVSVRNIDDQKMEPARFLLDQTREIVSLCRDLSQAPVVLGGAGYSIFPRSALEYLGADMGLQGEGEAVFPRLLERLQKGEDLSGVPGLYLPGKGLQGPRAFELKLDSLPWSEIFSWFRGVRNLKEYWMTVQTRRGCPLGCSYCSTPAIEGRRIRRRSPEAVAEDLRVQGDAGVEQFYFTDNTFNLPPDYARALCRSIKSLQRNFRWCCILYPGKLDSELARLLAEAGCQEASIGFESGSERMLRSLNKHFTPEEVRRTFQLLGDQGIHRRGFLLLGGPGETKESVMETLAFADSLPLESLKVTAGIRIYPQTELARTALREGVITEDTDLLFPTFYLAKGLEGWLHRTVGDWLADRPHWFI